MPRDWSQEQFVTVQEIASELRVVDATVRNWIEAGKLPAVRLGRRVRVTRLDLNAFIAQGYTADRAADGADD